MTHKTPPRLAAWLLTRISGPSIAGDYEEIYQEWVRDHGDRTARARYWTQVWRSLPMLTANALFGSTSMFKNYIKSAWRNILRRKRYALLNITGLAIGLAVCLLITAYVLHEKSFDTMHTSYDRIYRIIGTIPMGGQSLRNGVVSAPLGPAAAASIPEIESEVRLLRRHNTSVQVGNVEFKEEKIFLAEQAILQVFALPLHRGDPKSALEAPFTVILEEDLAKKYFGDRDPMGQTIRIMLNQVYDFTVTGVMRRLPSNTVLRRPMIASFATLQQIQPDALTHWESWGSFTTFVRLHERADPEAVSTKLTALARSNLPEEEQDASYSLQPISRIYLDNTSISNNLDNSGSSSRLYVFSAVAMLMLLIAAINFINLSTAKISGRLKEVGIRKTCGAVRGHLIKQFLTESLLLTTAAMVAGLLLFSLFKPRLDLYLGKTLILGMLATPWIFPLLAAVVMLVAFGAGSYPALFLSRAPAAVIFRSRLPLGISKSGMRRTLVGIQFFIAASLITCTLAVLKQVRFSETKDLGFDQTGLIVLYNQDAHHLENAEVIKRRLLNATGIISASSVDHFPYGQNRSLSTIRHEGTPEDVLVQSMEVDADFLPTMGLRLITGRNFQSIRTSDAQTLLLNEAAVRHLGFEEPLGKRIQRNDKNYHVIGVVEDWHTNSIHSPIHPTIFFPAEASAAGLVIRLPRQNSREVVARIREFWAEFMPGQIFNFAYIEDLHLHSYNEEKRLASLLVFFCGLTVVVACLGIFGLAAYSTEQRTKEIGIRKVLGSSLTGIILLLTQSYGRWVLAANLLAWPAAYFIVHKWLQAFAYRTTIGLDPFLLSGLITMLIALFSVIFQTLKAALADPVRSLRYE